MSLTGKIAIITGGTKGIGFATALHLRSLGASVVVNYNSDSSAAEEAVKKLGGDDHALAVQADISKATDRQVLIDAVVSKFNKIDILVNNAGIMIHQLPSVITEDAYDRTFAVNVKGPLFLTKLAAPHIPEGGRVVFLSSSLTNASPIGPQYSLYISSKGAIEQFSRAAAKEYGARGITVNTISPGPTETDLFTSTNTEQSVAMLKNLTPAKRLGQPEEIAQVIAFLASSQSSWVNGQNIKVNGGFVV